MSEQLNRLIAMGGTGTKSYIESMMEGRAQRGAEDRNALSMANTRQTMSLNQQKQTQAMEAERQKVAMGALTAIESNPNMANQIVSKANEYGAGVGIRPFTSMEEIKIAGAAAGYTPTKSDVLSKEAELQKIRMSNAAKKATGGKKHFSGQKIFKDAAGLLFLGTGVGDPSSGTVTPSMVAVNGTDVKPKGKLKLVNTIGQTSNEKLGFEQQLLTRKALAKDDVDFYTAYIPETRNMESSIDELEMTQGLLTDLSGQTDYSTVGFAKWINNIPLTDAKHFSELKHTIQSRLAMDKMMTLKNASDTGSTGFGQLSEKELKVLMDYLGSLEQAQSPKEIKKVITQVHGALGEITTGYRKQLLQNRQRHGALHKDYYGDTKELPSLNGGITTPQSEEEYNKLPSGAEYIDPDDGKTYRKP